MSIHRKLFKIWLTISSLVGFIAGWALLSHTVEVEAIQNIGNTVIEMPQFQDIPTLNGVDTQQSDNANVQRFSINTSQQLFSPPMRTGGS